MSRLDDHVSAVQNRLALGIFISALARGLTIFTGIVLLAVLVNGLFMWHPPRPSLWLLGGMGAVLVAAAIYAARNRPSPKQAAVPIDQKLGLKEKISTALYIRPDDDSFSRAALYDAEQTAAQIALNLREHFPLTFPRQAFVVAALALAAMLSYKYIDPMNLFDRRQKLALQTQAQEKVKDARKNVEQALANINAMPKVEGADEALRLAKADLQAMLNQPIADAEKANRTASKAVEDVNKALEQIKSSARYAQAQNEMKMMRSMQKPVEGQGPVSDAHRAIADGKFSEAIEDLSKAVENFDHLDKGEQQKLAQQMQSMAQQLQQMANNPAQQQKMEQQLQQMGMNPQQAQQAQQLMQQAVQGDKQAQQQLQQMAQQQMQQMNNGQGPTPQQQQQMQQMMQQMQAMKNAQNQAQQMAQSAQQMAQAMKQASQSQQAQQNSPQQQSGQQNQAMSQAMNSMQQQLQQMQAAAQDAQQIAAAQGAAQAAQQAAQGAMGGNKPGGQNGQGAGMWNPNGNIMSNGQRGQGQLTNARSGPNQGGIGAGDRTYKNAAPYQVKQEIDPSQDDEKGRILASNYIKDNKPNKGQSTETLKEVADRAQKEQVDEIDQERISRQAQKAVKEYFNSMSTQQQ
ncbi:MAG TPA: hypothetical protein VHD56_09070 [Tepidisphaeraceae bacterium]|nr:hypothetical protein [Tepidisphaeraceae bacterium]